MATAARSGAALGDRAIEVVSSRDRQLLRTFLERDRLRAAYAICDLDEKEFHKTKWGVAYERGAPIAVVLEYGGLTPQPLFVMGDAEGVAAVLRDVIKPRIVYLACDENAPLGSVPSIQGRSRTADGAHGRQRQTFRPDLRPGDPSRAVRHRRSQPALRTWASPAGCRPTRSPMGSTTASAWPAGSWPRRART